jgi:hypothetical protein
MGKCKGRIVDIEKIQNRAVYISKGKNMISISTVDTVAVMELM